MDKKLLIQAITKLLIGVLIVGALVFIPAGTFDYWNGWLFMGLLFIPMYAVTILLFLTIPLILGSIISFVIFLIYPIIIAKRIKNEEMVLEKELNGYSEYKKKVRYRIVPFIW